MSEVTFDAVQQQFELHWHTEHKLPLSLSIAEADYEAFFDSMWPSYQWLDGERDLLGEDHCAEFEERREYSKQHLSGIICYVNSKAIPLFRSAMQMRGTIVYQYAQTVEH